MLTICLQSIRNFDPTTAQQLVCSVSAAYKVRDKLSKVAEEKMYDLINLFLLKEKFNKLIQDMPNCLTEDVQTPKVDVEASLSKVLEMLAPDYLDAMFRHPNNSSAGIRKVIDAAERLVLTSKNQTEQANEMFYQTSLWNTQGAGKWENENSRTFSLQAASITNLVNPINSCWCWTERVRW